MTHLARFIFSTICPDMVVAWFTTSFGSIRTTHDFLEFSITLSPLSLELGFSSALNPIFFSPFSTLILFFAHLVTQFYTSKKGFKLIARTQTRVSRQGTHDKQNQIQVHSKHGILFKSSENAVLEKRQTGSKRLMENCSGFVSYEERVRKLSAILSLQLPIAGKRLLL